jgi:hypothetical protein
MRVVLFGAHRSGGGLDNLAAKDLYWPLGQPREPRSVLDLRVEEKTWEEGQRRM